jgi:hypothetical protein
LPDDVAVVARTFWEARRALDKADISWMGADPAAPILDSSIISADYRSRLDLGPFHVSPGERKRRLADHRRQALGRGVRNSLPGARHHDLRRSVATGTAELGIAPHMVEAVLNHVSGHKAGIAGVYNRATYEKEKRAALAMWADHVMATVEGRALNVVPLRNRIHHALYIECRERAERDASPTAAIIDSPRRARAYEAGRRSCLS